MIARVTTAAALLLAPLALLLAPQALLAGEATGGTTVTIDIVGLRNTTGQILACLTAKAETFPECEKDPQALHLTVPAHGGPSLAFRHVLPGTYAVSLFHDANSNNRLDKSFGIPKEGYGFSRDAPVWMGPPKFAAAQFVVGDADVTQKITIRYIL